jgi:hypothetical protein
MIVKVLNPRYYAVPDRASISAGDYDDDRDEGVFTGRAGMLEIMMQQGGIYHTYA